MSSLLESRLLQADNEDKLEGFGRLLQDGPAIERAFEETAERVEELVSRQPKEIEQRQKHIVLAARGLNAEAIILGC